MGEGVEGVGGWFMKARLLLYSLCFVGVIGRPIRRRPPPWQLQDPY